MHLSKHDLFQMNDEWLKKLPAELLLEVSKRLLHDVKELQDRLNQNPSSRPPTSQAPWAKTGGSEEQSGAADESGTADVGAETATGSSTEDTEQAPPVDGQRSSAGKGSGKRPGKQPGRPGHGRSQKLASTAPSAAQLVRQRWRRVRRRRLTRLGTKSTLRRRSRA